MSTTQNNLAWILAASNVAETCALDVARSAGLRVHVLREAYTGPAGDSDSHRTVLNDFEDDAALGNAVSIAARHSGKPSCVIAMDEYAILAAGKVRRILGLPGHGPADLVALRDKRVMHDRVQAAGILTTRRLSREELKYWDFTHPVIAKPADRAGSEKVRRLTSPTDHVDDDEVIEVWQEGVPSHVDGISVGGEMVFAQASTYGSGSCFDYTQGRPLTSWTLAPDDPQVAPLIDASAHVVHALRLPDGAFHCEFFVVGLTAVFLEIGARPGGGFIVEAVEAATGINLRKEHVRAGLGLTVTSTAGRSCAGGFWLLPPPGENAAAIRVVRATEPPALRSEVLNRTYPAVGDPLGHSDDYRDALASFTLAANDAAVIADDLATLTEQVQVICR